MGLNPAGAGIYLGTFRVSKIHVAPASTVVVNKSCYDLMRPLVYEEHESPWVQVLFDQACTAT